MTPRERAAKAWYTRISVEHTVHGQIEALAAVLDEVAAQHVHALLADDEATIEVVARAMVDAYCIRAVDAPHNDEVTQAHREAARAAIAALRRKAFAQ
jgi:hypothetical protein